MDQSSVRNNLLRKLSEGDFALLAPHLRPLTTRLREELIIANTPITECYFPESGLASVVADTQGRLTEIGIIGREGLVGASPLLLGDDRTPHMSVIQMSGTMIGVAAPALLEATERSDSLRRLLLLYVQTHLVQVAQTAYAQTTLDMEGRLARWLLMYHDRADGDELILTHEFLSIMLGVQRTGVTLAVQNLEGAGAIRARRARIQILDRSRLEALTKGAYGVPEAEYIRLIGDPGASRSSD